MSESKHTAVFDGKAWSSCLKMWRWIRTIKTNGQNAYRCMGCKAVYTDEQIAASDLLEVVKRALPHLQNDSPGGCNGKYQDCDHCDVIRQARAAIAKAEGK